MPKDATKNVDRYKIRGGQLNEFDFHQNQESLKDAKGTSNKKAVSGASGKKLASKKGKKKK